jgi:hypothetical protein
VIASPLPIYFSGNLQFKKCITSLWKCGGALSCWKSMSSGPSSSKIGMRNFPNMSRYTMLVTVSMAKKNGPNTFCLDKTRSNFDCL